jgi:DNA invertase Pin-like site-specific DNA recombinase
MLKFCKAEHIKHIVIFSYDRFSRTGDLSLLKDLRDHGIKVHAATQNVDDQTPSGDFSQSLYLMFVQMENEQLREKILEGLREKFQRGEWITAPTVGYDKRYTKGKKAHEHDMKQCFINDDGLLLRQAHKSVVASTSRISSYMRCLQQNSANTPSSRNLYLR